MAALHPDFPVVSGPFGITEDWSGTAAEPVNRRFDRDEGALVLWRPGLTAWLTVWGTDGQSPDARLAELRRDASPDAYGHRHWSAGALRYFTYRLAERSDDDRRPALYGFVVGAPGHVQLSVYFDTEDDLSPATALVEGITSG